MVKRGDELARGPIPELGRLVRACCNDLSTVRAKRRVPNTTLMVKGGDQLPRDRVPELGSFVPACRQNPSTVRTKCRAPETILMIKGGDERWQRLFAMYNQFLEKSF